MKTLFDIAKRMPALIDYIDPSLEKIEPTLHPSKYASLVIISTLLSFAIGYAVLGVPGAVGFGICAALFFILLPKLEERSQVATMEAELPYMLQTIALFMNLKIPFGQALELTKSDSPLGLQLGILHSETMRGVPFSKAILERVKAINSEKITRVFSQLISIHRSGATADSLEHLAQDLMFQKRLDMKEHAARASVFGMTFIILSAVLPTFLVVMGIVGPATGFGLGMLEITLALLVGIPLIDGLLVILMHKSAPIDVFTKKNDGKLIGIGIGCGIAGALAALVFPQYVWHVLLVLFALASIYAIPFYKKENHEEKIHDQMPNALMGASSLSPLARPNDFFEALKNSSGKELAGECDISQKQLLSKASLESVLEDWHSRIPAKWMKHFVDVSLQVFNTNSFSKLHTLAEDMLWKKEQARERKALLSTQKYTLVLGSFIVPLILGQVIVLAGSLSENFGKSAIEFETLHDSIIPAYLILYALLCGIYLSWLDDAPYRSVAYGAAIALFSLAVFWFL